MERRTVFIVEEAVEYIEENLSGRLGLDAVAEAVHYSKYHLHRMFTETVGMTMHDYIGRRQLTEAAKLLVFSERPVIDIALLCGYESQQAFSLAFKSMYKIPPAEYRERKLFYPLQLRFSLVREACGGEVSKADIRLAELSDIPAWLGLVRLVIDGYPCLDEREYCLKLQEYIGRRQALILKKGEIAVGVMAFSYGAGRNGNAGSGNSVGNDGNVSSGNGDAGSDNDAGGDGKAGTIDFLGIHPQYRNKGIQKLFLETLMEEYLPGREISTTTYREKDRADTGYREELKRLGFAERELLVEFGYPTQRMTLTPSRQTGLARTRRTAPTADEIRANPAGGSGGR